MEKLSLTFKGAWVLSKKEDECLPVDTVLRFLATKWDVQVMSSSLTDCEVIVKNADATAAGIYTAVEEFLKTTYDIELDGETAAVSVVTVDTPLSPDETANAEVHKQMLRALKSIDELIGADEFKALCYELVDMAPGLLSGHLTDVFAQQSYLISINDGHGQSTYLKLFTELTEALGLFTYARGNAVAEEVIPAASKEEPDPLGAFIKRIARIDKRYSQLICVDISEWMSKVGDKAFANFLSKLEDYAGRHIFVFRVPFVEREVLAKIERAISDRLFLKTLSFVPFSDAQLMAYANQLITERGYTLDKKSTKLLEERLREERNDGRFYGINTVRKVVVEMLYRKQLRNARKSKPNNTAIVAGDLDGFVADAAHREKSGVEILDGMIGMEPLKKRVEEIVAQIQVAMQNAEVGSPCIHMRFVGNPGTGKTTVARVIGKILKEKGILRNGHFFEHSGRDFCGRYVGETAPKTAAMCRDAYGSVLFIDEAYSLYREGASSVDYGREAIDTLIAEMENHRSDLVVIMAGYPDEMATLMKGNAGLASRMPYVIEFPNYTREQLTAIFLLMAKKGFSVDERLEEAVKAYFDALPEEVITAKEFSNARFVRNLFERTWGKAVLRSQLENVPCKTITAEDFGLASGEKEFSELMNKTAKITLGFA